MTRQVTGFSEVECRQEYLDKMTGEAEVLRPLVEACLDNDPLKRPSILDLSKKTKPLKVCIYVIASYHVYICYKRNVVKPDARQPQAGTRQVS